MHPDLMISMLADSVRRMLHAVAVEALCERNLVSTDPASVKRLADAREEAAVARRFVDGLAETMLDRGIGRPLIEDAFRTGRRAYAEGRAVPVRLAA